jgi:hypothetical protein
LNFVLCCVDGRFKWGTPGFGNKSTIRNKRLWKNGQVIEAYLYQPRTDSWECESFVLKDFISVQDGKLQAIIDTVTFLPKGSAGDLVSQPAQFLDQYPNFKLQYIKSTKNTPTTIVVRISESASISEEALNKPPPPPRLSIHNQIIDQQDVQDRFRVGTIDVDIGVNEDAFVIQTYDADFEAALFKFYTLGSTKWRWFDGEMLTVSANHTYIKGLPLMTHWDVTATALNVELFNAANVRVGWSRSRDGSSKTQRRESRSSDLRYLLGRRRPLVFRLLSWVSTCKLWERH